MAEQKKSTKPTKKSERQRDAERKRLSRAKEKDVVIPKCANKRRRKRLERDIFAWLRWYGGEEFTRDFTDVQREMTGAILNALKLGGDQAVAAPRGEGKSSVAEWVLIYCVLTGLVKFGVIFAATGGDAESSLDSIRTRIEENERLADDYPEACEPVRALEFIAQRANGQTVSGHRYDNSKPFTRQPSRFSWCGREIHFPRVPGSPASGAIIATRGLDAAVRGMKRGSRRPQIAIIDDPDTDEALAIDTPIPTPNGFVALADIQPGYTVFDENGQPCEVLGVSEVFHDRRCYKVTFDDGSEVIADAGHLWRTSTALQRTNERRHKPSNFEWSKSRPQCMPQSTAAIVTTDQIRLTMTAEGGRSNHSIPVAGPLETAAKDLPIPPYTLGAWLGDGSSRINQITSIDAEVLFQIEQDGFRIGAKISNAPTYTIHGLHRQLHECNLIRNKHVPENYLFATGEQRLALLQGLMDTDGWAGSRDSGQCVFSNTNKQLVDTVAYLCRSLGIKTRVRFIPPKPVSGAAKANQTSELSSPAWHVAFTTSLPVFRLQRKLARLSKTRRANLSRLYVKSVELVDSVPVKCLKVGSPSHMFLCGRSLIPTHNTVNSEEQSKKLEKKIDRSIAGLAGQEKRLSRVILTTVQRRDCVSARFTDPTIKHSFRGRRFKFLINPPERIDLWEEYVALRHADLANGTNYAHEHYVANRALMDGGALVGNPHRRGDAGELSALQFYFNEVARIGQEAVDTEYQNDPPEESGPIESGITAHRIQRQVSGYERKIIPPGCTVLTCGVDVRKVALHWVVRAWQLNGTGFTINYGVHEVHGTTYGSDEGVDLAVKRAILAFLDEQKTSGNYARIDGGEVQPIDLTLIDAGWQTAAVYAACAEAGLGVMPVMGFGKSAGCAQANFSEIQHRTQDKRPGDGWFLSRKGSLWLVCADTDRWKAWEHARWLTAPGKPGAMQIFGETDAKYPDRLSADEKGHHSYARHIVNEVEVEEPHKGTMRRRWKPKSENTHWLDASYYADVAANMKGVKILQSVGKVTDVDGNGRRKVVIPAHMRRS